jgi:hypothetical protein
VLATRLVKTLQMPAPPAPGRPSHVSAASGLVRIGPDLYIVADDELHLAVVPLAPDAPGRWVRLFPGELPLEHKARKASKPDLEALARLPPLAGAPHGALLALGSGSTPRRERAVLLPLEAEGSLALATSARGVDLSPLYGQLRQRFAELNIEGAAVRGDTLVLLQRGNGPSGANATVEVEVAALLEGRSLAPRIHEVDLGSLDGVRLTFTDASPLPDGRLAFCAAAEDTADTYQDGPCVGAAVGVLAPDGRLDRLERLDRALKVEGIHAEAEGTAVRLLLVSDGDDVTVAAPLLEAWL